MAKVSAIQKNKRRQKLVASHAKKLSLIHI